MSTSDLSFALLLLLLLLMTGFAAYFGFLWHKATKKIYEADERHSLRLAQALRQLDKIFKRRTGLSADLISVAAGDIGSPDYRKKADIYLSFLVDDLEKLFSDYTQNVCVVSIKLLSYDTNLECSIVQTRYRDSNNGGNRLKEYSHLEPFEIEQHSFISMIVNRTPFDAFFASDDIRSDYTNYQNPNDNWKSLFNSSAIHAVVSPDHRVQEKIFGFLCVDNRKGGLDNDVVKALMAIVSTSIFYVISGSETLDSIRQDARN